MIKKEEIELKDYSCQNFHLTNLVFCKVLKNMLLKTNAK